MKMNRQSAGHRPAPSRFGLGSGMLVAMLAGCAPNETADPAENIEVQMPASTQLWSWTDWSGTSEIRAWYCDWAGPGRPP